MQDVAVRKPKYEVTVFRIERFEGIQHEDVGFFIDRLMEEMKFERISGSYFRHAVRLKWSSQYDRVLRSGLIPADAKVGHSHENDTMVFAMWQQGEDEDTLIHHRVEDRYYLCQHVYRRLGESEWFAKDVLEASCLWNDDEDDGRMAFDSWRLFLEVVKLV